jgi:transposase
METWRPKALTASQREERRLEGARLLKQGELCQADIAQRLGVSRAAVAHWAEQLRHSRGNLQELRCRGHSGRPARLSDSDWEQVLTWLAEGAAAAGYSGERWTLRRVVDLIHRRFGVRYTRQYLSLKLHAMGLTPQHPIPQARERDEVLVKAWLERDWPRIKKVLRDA